MAKDVKITFQLSEAQAWGLSQLVKRAARRNIGPAGLDLVTPDEEPDAESGLYLLRDALADAGFAPR